MAGAAPPALPARLFARSKAVYASRESLRPCLGRQRLGQARDGAELSQGRAPGRAHELDRDVEKPLQALEHELGHVGGVVGHLRALFGQELEIPGDQSGQVDLQFAVDREAGEPDRRPAQPVRVAGAPRSLSEREGDGRLSILSAAESTRPAAVSGSGPPA